MRGAEKGDCKKMNLGQWNLIIQALIQHVQCKRRRFHGSTSAYQSQLQRNLIIAVGNTCVVFERDFYQSGTGIWDLYASQNAVVMPGRNNLGSQHRPQQVFTRLVFAANDREQVTTGRFLTQQKWLDDTNLAQFSASLLFGGFKFRRRVSRFLVNKGRRVKSTG